MKYHELDNIQSVQCYQVGTQTKEQHDKAEQTDDGCMECMDLYIDLKDDLIEVSMFENKNRSVVDIWEQSNYENNGRLCFAIWSVPN